MLLGFSRSTCIEGYIPFTSRSLILKKKRGGGGGGGYGSAGGIISPTVDANFWVSLRAKSICDKNQFVKKHLKVLFIQNTV